jgi:hypothetical protein
VTTLRRVGAVALLGVGATHLYELSVDHYDAIPTIGTLFVLNVVAAWAVGLAILGPVERLPARAGVALAATGAAIAAGSLVALWISESTGLFGFTEAGFRAPIAISVVCEAVAALALGHVALAPVTGSRPRPRLR